MKVINRKGAANDTRINKPQAISTGHASGRRQGGGSGVVGETKASQLKNARVTSLANKRSFRSGSQDARDAGAGPKSPSELQVRTRRRGNGPVQHMPPAHNA